MSIKYYCDACGCECSGESVVYDVRIRALNGEKRSSGFIGGSGGNRKYHLCEKHRERANTVFQGDGIMELISKDEKIKGMK